MGEQEQQPTPQNYALLQGFEWHCLEGEKNADHGHLKRLAAWVPKLKAIGLNNIWTPPACKAASPEGNGYDIYDLYDLGEFDQKGTVPTKWGTKQDLLDLIQVGKDNGVGIVFDAVLNHKAGADSIETCKVVECDPNVSDEFEIDAWLGFDFPGRKDKYSKMKYHWGHFSGTDYDDKTKRTGVFQICGEGKHWSESVDSENGNADYMMFADVDYSHPHVIDDVKNWAAWMVDEIGVSGFRFDAIQHFSQRFTNELMDKLSVRKPPLPPLFYVGEFWIANVDTLCQYLDDFDHKVSLFDAPLFYNFSSISSSEAGDLRKVFDKSLTQASPTNAVTVCGNHDTQRGQTMAMPIAGWFKPLAHALIMLRVDGYPCVFYGDLFGIKGDNPEEPSCGGQLADICLARHLYSYGEQNDYWDNPNCIGWVRRGTWDKPDGLACVMSNTGPGQLRMYVGELHSGEVWTDVLNWSQKSGKIGEDGFGEFDCAGISMSVYVNQKAKGRDQFGKFDDDIYGERK